MKTIKKLWLLFQIRSLQITIDGRASVINLVTDPMTKANMEMAQNEAFTQLRKLQREYQS